MKFLAFVNFYCRLIQKLMTVILTIMFVSTLIMISGRYIPFIPPFFWTIEVVRFGMIWMIFLGAAVALREREHFFVDIMPVKYGKNKNISGILYIVYAAVILIFSYIYIVYGVIYFKDWCLVQHSEILQINMGFIFFSVPLCGVNSFLFFVAELVEKKLGIERKEVQE